MVVIVIILLSLLKVGLGIKPLWVWIVVDQIVMRWGYGSKTIVLMLNRAVN
jgi:hypothetical protein